MSAEQAGENHVASLLSFAALFALVVTMPARPSRRMQPSRPRTRKRPADDEIVVTAARTILPPNALPLTVDVIDKTTLDQQIAISGSVTDAVANLTPSFSPTRQKLSGAGETLRGRSPLYAINGIPQSTPLRDGSARRLHHRPFFIDRVELIYGSNALQGIGGTGGIVNQVTVGAPPAGWRVGRVLVQGSADNDFHGDGIGGKVAGPGRSGRPGASMRRSAQPMTSAAPSTTATAAASA
jgi:iron complex outermembrane receptor protein